MTTLKENVEKERDRLLAEVNRLKGELDAMKRNVSGKKPRKRKGAAALPPPRQSVSERLRSMEGDVL